MGIFDKLFGRGERPAAEAAAEAATEYKGFSIRPTPQKQGSGWLLVGVISKGFPDGVKEHKFIRADTFAGRDEAAAFTITKAKQLIDEQGDRLFGVG